VIAIKNIWYFVLLPTTYSDGSGTSRIQTERGIHYPRPVTTLCLKKRHTWYCPYLCQMLTDFTKFFHCHTLWTTGNKTVIEYPTTP